MANGSQRDRNPQQVELTKTPWPVSPLNLFLSGSFRPGAYDLSWDDPSIQPLNGDFKILGVNLYRSHDSEYGPYERITDLPLGATFWRDQTDNELVVEEDVSSQFLLRGFTSASGSDAPRYVFQTLHYPIVQEGSQQVPTNSPRDVRVYIDGVEARVIQVFGSTGEVEIDSFPYPDVLTQKMVQPLLPTENSRVTCTYRYTRKLLKTDLLTRVFYRVTTVGVAVGSNMSLIQSTDLLETPLEHAVAVNNYENEKLDYIWREGIRRNRFILTQGGERVKLFIRKTVGLPCVCIPDDYHKQPINDCLHCYGTGILGGYEGPYDILIAPQDSERKIAQKDIGRTVEQTDEVWTSPTPLISQRDFVVKLNGDRYSIGGVRLPSNRGTVLQQHFNINSFDEKDIRYKVPIGNPIKYVATQFAPSGPELSASHGPTDNPNIPEERQLKGLTPTWVNTTY